MLLELDHISKIYGDLHAVDDLNLTVPEGEWPGHRRFLRFGQDHADEHDWLHGHASKGSVKLEGRKLEDLNATQLATCVRTSSAGIPEVLSGAAPDRCGKRDGGAVLPFGGR